MQEYQQRVIDECFELETKTSVLTGFMHTDIYANLSAPEQGLMMVQLAAMTLYIDTLNRRIELF